MKNTLPILHYAIVSEDFRELRFAVKLARGGGNTEWASWKDIEELLAAYDELKSKHGMSMRAGTIYEVNNG